MMAVVLISIAIPQWGICANSNESLKSIGRLDDAGSLKPDSPILQVANVPPIEVEMGGIAEISNVLFHEETPNRHEEFTSRLLTGKDPLDCLGGQVVTVTFQRTIRVPIGESGPSGLYRLLICVQNDDVKSPVPFIIAPIHVVQPRIELTSVHVAPLGYYLELRGQHLDRVKNATDVRVDCQHGPMARLCLIASSSNMVSLELDKAEFGACHVKAANGDGVFSNELAVTILPANRQGDSGAAVVETVPFVSIVGLIVWLLWAIGKKRQDRMVPLVLEEGSRRISLSRLQLLVWVIPVTWTVIEFAVLGTVYDSMPNGVFVLVLLSVFTAGCGTYLNYLRWSDGPSQTEPCRWDLFMEFGQVIWERVLFCFCVMLTLLFMAFNSVEAVYNRTESLLEIPGWLIAVNCLVSVLFLLGKVIRSAGPQVMSVSATQGSLELTISGGNLSPDAKFFIDDRLNPVHPEMIRKVDGEHKPEVIEDDYRRRGYARVLKVIICGDIPMSWIEGEHELHVRNPDGQTAVCKYRLAVGITGIKYHPEKPWLTLTGFGFDDECKVTVWDLSKKESAPCNIVAPVYGTRERDRKDLPSPPRPDDYATRSNQRMVSKDSMSLAVSHRHVESKGTRITGLLIEHPSTNFEKAWIVVETSSEATATKSLRAEKGLKPPEEESVRVAQP